MSRLPRIDVASNRHLLPAFIEDFHFSLMHLDPAQVCLRSSVACQYLELTPEF